MTEPVPITAEVAQRAVLYVEVLASRFFQHDWRAEDEDEAFHACVKELLEGIQQDIQQRVATTRRRIDAWSN